MYSLRAPWFAAILALAPLTTAQTTLFRAIGPGNDAEYGCAVAAAGDIDGDGFDDVLIGSRNQNGATGTRNGGGPGSGAAHVLSGLDGSSLLVVAGGLAQQFGWSVAGGGDIDGDGFADLVFGAPADGALGRSSGRVEIVSGRTAAVIHSLASTGPGVRFGQAVAAGGDVDGDGFDDVVVGAPLSSANGRAYSGTVHVFSGRTGLELQRFHGDSPGDLFGFSVAMPGDLDRDGCDEVLVGALRDADNGADCGSVRVFSGRTGAALYTVYGTAVGARLGHAVGRCGDVDRDGTPDFIAGAPGSWPAGPAGGAAHVLSGLNGAGLLTLTYSNAVDGFGTAVAGAGDVDGDNWPDLLVGAERDAFNGPETGAVHVYSGRDGSRTHTIFGDHGGDRFGWSVAGAGDVNGDGFAEILVGAIKQAGSGAAEVIDLGGSGSPPRHRTRGAGCVGSLGRLPRIGYVGAATLGSVFTLTLRGAAYSAPDAMLLIGPRTQVPLDVIGLTGCTLYALSDNPIRVGTNALGVARTSLRLPVAVSALGRPFDAQWIVVDPGAPYPLPLVTSNALTFEIGN